MSQARWSQSHGAGTRSHVSIAQQPARNVRQIMPNSLGDMAVQIMWRRMFLLVHMRVKACKKVTEHSWCGVWTQRQVSGCMRVTKLQVDKAASACIDFGLWLQAMCVCSMGRIQICKQLSEYPYRSSCSQLSASSTENHLSRASADIGTVYI